MKPHITSYGFINYIDIMTREKRYLQSFTFSETNFMMQNSFITVH